MKLAALALGAAAAGAELLLSETDESRGDRQS